MNDSPGAHLIGRVGAVLRALSATNETGTVTSDLARATDLPRPTVHRLLTSLAEEGFVDRDRRTGRWFLVPELYLLGQTCRPGQPLGPSALPDAVRARIVRTRRDGYSVTVDGGGGGP